LHFCQQFNADEPDGFDQKLKPQMNADEHNRDNAGAVASLTESELGVLSRIYAAGR